MKFGVLLCALALSATSIYAQTGVISSETLKSIRSSYDNNDTETKALRNAIRSNKSLKELALNADVAKSVDHTFKYKVTGNNTISNQYSSGRCWMFTSMNVLRPAVVEKYNLRSFEFSYNYNYFWDMFEKSNLFLENMITTAKKDMDDREVVAFFNSPVDDGGVWNHFYNTGKKYGVVPASVMPETIHSNNTNSMRSVINERLRKGGFEIRESVKKGEKAMREIKMATLKDVYRILALCLGEPPVSFDWKYTDKSGKVQVIKDLTPAKFYSEIVPESYDENTYIMVMNDPTRPYYKVYDIKNYRNTLEGTNWVYLNLPNKDIKEAALKSIKDNEPMYSSSDVGKELNMTEGVLAMNMYDMESLLGIDLSMDKRAKILTRQSGSAHAMMLVGCDTDENDNPVKWEFENSWGASSGNRGYLTFTDEWFDNYIFRVVIKKDYLNDEAKKALNGKKVELPVWDYMF